MRCASVCTLEGFVRIPEPFDSSASRLAASIGEFGGFFFLRVILTTFGTSLTNADDDEL